MALPRVPLAQSRHLVSTPFVALVQSQGCKGGFSQEPSLLAGSMLKRAKKRAVLAVLEGNVPAWLGLSGKQEVIDSKVISTW